MTNLEAALVYATKLGWHVFPVRPDKKPYTPNGLYDATTDPAAVTRWWTQFPSASIGVRTGAESGIVVLDVDVGKDGFESLALLTAEHGALPVTPASITGGGGRHFLFAHPGEPVRNSVSTLGHGLDVRGDGGYIIVAPSKHASGNLYAWETAPIDVQPAPLPAWLFERINAKAARQHQGKGNPAASTELITEGGRNAELFSIAGLFRAQGMDEDQVYSMLAATNLVRCVPPLEDSEIRALARSVSRYEAGPALVEEWDESNTSTELISGGRRLGATTPDESDLGNARRFAERYGKEARYIKAWDQWLLWEGTHWRSCEDAEPDRMCHVVADSIGDEVGALRAELATLSAEIQAETQAAAADADSGGGVDPHALDRKRQRAMQLGEEIKFLTKHARDSKSERSLRAMKRLGAQLRPIDTKPYELNADPFLLNVANGTLELRTGNLRPHHRNDLMTRIIAVPYDSGATCPRWESFLLEIMCGDSDLVSFIQRAVGYSLTGSVSSQVLFFMHGDGRNGKSTVINVIKQLLSSYAATGATTLLEDGNNHPTEIADLRGRRAVFISETDSKPLPQAQIKRLTSEEGLKARKMREDFSEFLPTHKLWLSGNHKPRVVGTDLGIWRRINLIPFRYTVPENRVDIELPAALAAELPGILAWAVRGCAEWFRAGLRPPEAVLAATDEYREEEDLVGNFLEERCERVPGGFVGSLQLYQAFAGWCEQCGFRVPDIKAFKRRMESSGFPPHRTNTQRGYNGVRLAAGVLQDVSRSS